jgi:hypothetical protein
MTLLTPGMSVSLYCVGDPQHTSPNHMLNGNTVSGGVTLEAGTAEPLSGTRWYVVDAGAGLVALQCLGDLAGNRYLNGRTNPNDLHVGSVDLAPSTSGFTGTRWQVADDGSGGVTLQCMGADQNPKYEFLDGRTADGSVGLAPSTDGVFTGTHWTLVDVVDHSTTPASFNSPALTYGVDGPNVFGVAMAWTGFDGRINVQRLVESQPPRDVTMLADVAIDRPALVVHNERLHLAFTAPDGSIHVMASDDAHAFDTVDVLNVGTRLGPGLASWNGSIVVAWADAGNGGIHVRDVDRGVQVDLADTSAFAPALLGVVVGPARDNYLHLAWTGTDSAHTLNTRWAQYTVTNLQDDRGKEILPDGSIDGPALAWREDVNSGLEPGLVLGWTGRPGGPDGDNHLNVAYQDAGLGHWDFKTTVASTSNRGPAVTYFNQTVDPKQGVLFTAWDEKLPSLRIDTGNFLNLPVIPT